MGAATGSVRLTDENLQRMLEQTLIPSPNVFGLDSTPLESFVRRTVPMQDDVAETFHLNSKLTDRDRSRVLDSGSCEEVRRWFLEGCGHVAEDDLVGPAPEVRILHADLPRPLANLLVNFGSGGQFAPMLFSNDLMVLFQGAVLRQVPGEDWLWREHDLTDAELSAVASAPLDIDPALMEQSIAVLVIVGVPWRNMLMTGPRGYRRTLVDAGLLLSAVGSLAQQIGLVPHPSMDFVDRAVDQAMANDGTERGAQILVALCPPDALPDEEPSTNATPTDMEESS